MLAHVTLLKLATFTAWLHIWCALCSPKIYVQASAASAHNLVKVRIPRNRFLHCLHEQFLISFDQRQKDSWAPKFVVLYICQLKSQRRGRESNALCIWRCGTSSISHFKDMAPIRLYRYLAVHWVNVLTQGRATWFTAKLETPRTSQSRLARMSCAVFTNLTNRICLVVGRLTSNIK